MIAAYRADGILSQTDFIVTADHGMSRVSARVSFDTLKQATQMAGTKQVFIEADTAATLGIADESKSRSVALNVARVGGKAIDATYFAARGRGGPRFDRAYARPGLSSQVLRAYDSLVNTEEPD